MRALPLPATQSQIDFTTTTVNPDGSALYASEPWRIALGKVPNAFLVNKFGRDPDVDSGTVPEDLWNGGGVYTGFPVGAAENMQAFSSNAGDTGVLTIIGLDADYNATTRTVTLQGTTPVTVPGGTMVRMHTAFYNNGAATTFNLGNITVRHATTTANVFCFMPIGTSQTQVAVYTVPAGYTALLLNAEGYIRGGTSAVADGFFWVREFGKSPRLRRPFTIAGTVPYDDVIFGGLALPEKTDICVRVTACSANNVEVTMKFDLLVVQDA